MAIVCTTIFAIDPEKTRRSLSLKFSANYYLTSVILYRNLC